MADKTDKADKTGAAAKPGNAPATPPDPIAALVTALSGDDVDEPARKQARTQFSAIADEGRPWEQLPSGLKTAARADARRLLSDAQDKRATMLEAGYHPSVAGRLLRDLGSV